MAAKLQPEIWLVGGSSGEYSDRREWIVAAYVEESQAKAWVERMAALGREAAPVIEAADSSDEADEAFSALKAKMCEIDPSWSTYSDDPPNYTAWPVQLRQTEVR